MKKNIKIIYVAFVMLISFCIPLMFNGVFASDEGIVDYDATNDSYTLNDEDNKIYMPFLRIASGSVNINSEINNMGAIFSSSTIDLNSKINKSNFIFASDTIRVNNDAKNSIMFSNSNIIIDSKISGDLILLASSEITITENASIDGDVLFLAPVININGNVSGNIIGCAGIVNVKGKIEKDLRVMTDSVNIDSKELISGKIYIESYSEIQGIKDMYPDAVIKIAEKKSESVIDKLIYGIITCLTFTLIYILIYICSKKKFFANQLEKIKKNTTKTVLISIISLIIAPVIVILAIVLISIRLYFIAVPILVIYAAMLIIAAMLSVFVIGSTITSYICEKYFKEKNDIWNYGMSFIVFLILYGLSIVPFLSGYLPIVYLMVSMGIMTTCAITRVEKAKEE